MDKKQNATQQYKELVDHYKNPSLRSSLYYQIRLNGTFDNYLEKHYGVQIGTYELVNKISSKQVQKSDDLYLISSAHNYRPINYKDVSVLNDIWRKYYQDSGEIGLRIFLLFDSKFGSKFIAKKTNISFQTISNLRYDIRHGKTEINKIDAQTKMALENFYLNSRLATHINAQKLTFSI